MKLQREEAEFNPAFPSVSFEKCMSIGCFLGQNLEYLHLNN